MCIYVVLGPLRDGKLLITTLGSGLRELLEVMDANRKLSSAPNL